MIKYIVLCFAKRKLESDKNDKKYNIKLQRKFVYSHLYLEKYKSHIIFNSVMSSPSSCTIHPYHLSLLSGLPNDILCLHRADVNKFLLVSQHWQIHVLGSIEESHLWIPPYFSSSVWYVLLGWFLRLEVSGCTAAVLLGVASRICSK